MKIQEYKLEQHYIGFQWNGEDIQEVQKSIKKIAAHFGVAIPYEPFISIDVMELCPNDKTLMEVHPNDQTRPSRIVTKGDHVFISNNGKVEVFSKFSALWNFEITELEEAK